VTLDFGKLGPRSPGASRREDRGEDAEHVSWLNVIAFLVAGVDRAFRSGLWRRDESPAMFSSVETALTFFLLYSLPVFWVGLLLMPRPSPSKLGWLPFAGGWTSDEYLDLGFAGRRAGDRLKHLVLPVADARVWPARHLCALFEVGTGGGDPAGLHHDGAGQGASHRAGRDLAPRPPQTRSFRSSRYSALTIPYLNLRQA